MSNGLIHVYIGNGKGKTTAAIGLVVRAVGCGKKAVFSQFLKGRATGEVSSLEKLGIRVLRTGQNLGFAWGMSEEKKEILRDAQTELLKKVKDAISEVDGENGDPVEILVMDEVIDAVAGGLLDEDAFKEFIMQKPQELEVVLTGHCVIEWLMEKADYVTEMNKVKHPYDRGVKARESIEY